MKTLKDIYVLDGKTDLKEEALKQLKSEFYDFSIFENYCNDCDWLIEKAVKDYIKWFFNITDKDIKDYNLYLTTLERGFIKRNGKRK